MPLLKEIEAGPSSKIYLWKASETLGELGQIMTLTNEERSVLNSFMHEFRQKQWFAVRALLFSVLPNDRIRYDEHGKPWLESGNKFISISHTGDHIAIMLSDRHCGVDIEMKRDTIERIAPRFLSTAELSQVDDADRITHLHYYWSVKEAAYKMFGRKNVSLRDDIAVTPFSVSSSGKVFVNVTDHESTISSEASFMQLEDLILGWITA